MKFDNPTLSVRLKSFFIIGICLLMAIVLGWMVGTADYQILTFGLLIAAGVAFWFGSGRFFWVLTVASSFLGGTFPILGGSFNTFQILMVVGIAKFVIEDLVMRRTVSPGSSRIDLLLIAGFMGILTLHGLHDRFGMKFLGSTIWGGRNYVNVYVGFLAFFAVQSIPIRGRLWDRLPYLVLAVTTFDLLIAVVTAVFPSTIFKIYPFYSAVSVAGTSEILTGHEEITGRVGNFGNFGCALMAVILARVSLPRLFSLQNLTKLAASGVAAIAVAFSGFRSSVASFFLTVLMAAIRDLRLRALAILPLVAILLLGISFVNSSMVRLPKQVQRAFTFVPGDWDADMKSDADASNDFRKNIWSLFMQNYFPQHPWLGRGFGFRSEWAEAPIDIAGTRALEPMVETGNIHNGFLASLDALGAIGTIFFIAWNLRLLIKTFRASFVERGEGSFALRFVAIVLAVDITSYWGGAVTVGTYLPQVFALAGVFLSLQRKKLSQALPLAESARPLPLEHPSSTRRPEAVLHSAR